MRHDSQSPLLIGFWAAAVIIFLWIGSLGFPLLINIDRLTARLTLAAVLGRTFTQTGLFIVAHDAVHGDVLPISAISSITDRRWNNTIEELVVRHMHYHPTIYGFPSAFPSKNVVTISGDGNS
jgi:beta-carotene/zeaxanthin 4-ketolase